MKFVRTLCTLTAATLLSSCSALIPRSPALQQRPLLVVSCPSLSPLTDDSFGATTIKLVEVSQQYNECRDAALAEAP